MWIVSLNAIFQHSSGAIITFKVPYLIAIIITIIPGIIIFLMKTHFNRNYFGEISSRKLGVNLNPSLTDT